MIHTVYSVQNNRVYFYGTYKQYQDAADRMTSIEDAMREDGFTIDHDHQITCEKVVPGLLWNGVQIEHVGYLGIHSGPIVYPTVAEVAEKPKVNAREQMMEELRQKLQEFSFGLQSFVQEDRSDKGVPENEESVAAAQLTHAA